MLKSWIEKKMWSWVPTGQETRMTVLARPEGNYCSALYVPSVVDAVSLNELIKQTRIGVMSFNNLSSHVF
jgi:hypothetical protein